MALNITKRRIVGNYDITLRYRNCDTAIIGDCDAVISNANALLYYNYIYYIILHYVYILYESLSEIKLINSIK